MNRVRRWLTWAVMILAIAWLAAGCNTIEGAGRDIEAGGEAIQRSVD